MPTRVQSVLAGLVLLHAVALPAQHIPFYSPPYEPGVGGYQGGFFLVLPPSPRVSETGIGYNFALKYDGSGRSLGVVAVRWDSSGNSIELPGASLNSPFDAYVYDVNAAGVAVGGQSDKAIRWDLSGTATVLTGLVSNNRAGSASAWAINDAGDVAGVSSRFISPALDSGTRAVRWNQGETMPTELGILGTDIDGRTFSYVMGMNNNRTVVGTLAKYSDSHEYLGAFPVRWDGSGTTVTELQTLNRGGGVGGDNALGINSVGTIFGWCEKIDSSGRDLGQRAVRWGPSSTAVTELATLGTDDLGVTQTFAFGMNDAGTIVGQAPIYVEHQRIGNRPVRWEASGEITELGTLAPTYPNGTAVSINSSGIAVGFVSVDTIEEGRAVYWGLDGVPIDLNNLIAPNDHWVLYAASSITDSGWIAGGGAYDADGPGGAWPVYRPFLMQLPDPASGGVALVACLLTVDWRGRRRARTD